MSALNVRWIDSHAFTQGEAMALRDALDLGAAIVLDVVVTVEEAGTGTTPQILLKHAARNATGDYMDFRTPVAVDLTASGQTWAHMDEFTRFLGWELSGTLDTNAVVSVDIVAKG